MFKSKFSTGLYNKINTVYFWRKCQVLGYGKPIPARFLMVHASIENPHVMAYVEWEDGSVMEYQFDQIKFDK